MPTKLTIKCNVNGKEVEVCVPAWRTLSDMLRVDLGLTGLKIGCGKGECGACTVILDGEPVCSCLVMAGQANGRKIVTIEAIGEGPTGQRVQEAFLSQGAVQCGFCIPGMVVSATSLLEKQPCASHDDIVDGLAGNLCRCTGYAKIIDAVETARDKEKK